VAVRAIRLQVVVARGAVVAGGVREGVESVLLNACTQCGIGGPNAGGLNPAVAARAGPWACMSDCADCWVSLKGGAEPLHGGAAVKEDANCANACMQGVDLDVVGWPVLGRGRGHHCRVRG
jgi:hypothetical protein